MIDFPVADREAREGSILGLRPPRNAVDPSRPYGFFVEDEPRAGGGTDRVATVFLTNRECPWRCLMCDLWKNTLEAPTPKGAIPAQMRFALERLPSANVLKLYNAGSFFDRAAIPRDDHEEIASLARGFERVVVECHPALVGDSSLRFRDLLGGPHLQVALGLETANEEILRRLNKGMTVADFENACRFLAAHAIGIRSFVLVGLPFLRRGRVGGRDAREHRPFLPGGRGGRLAHPDSPRERHVWKSCRGKVSSSLRRLRIWKWRWKISWKGKRGTPARGGSSSSPTSGMPTLSTRPVLLRARPASSACAP